MNAVDRFVGQRIRQRRIELGKSQADLAAAIGVRFQQVQKYESGLNRVSASRLWDIAEALMAPVETFFEGIAATADDQAATPQSLGTDFGARGLMRDFRKLSEPQRRAIVAIVRSMAGEKPETAADEPARRG